MNYEEQYKKETGRDFCFMTDFGDEYYYNEYTKWLLEQLEKRDKKLNKILEIIEHENN
jgi:hypothetical protein